MKITIFNEHIKLTINQLGAEMMSLTDSEGIEYLWQGAPGEWSDHAPNLFPFIGRLTKNSYTYEGKVYPMGLHGFAAGLEFSVEQQTDTQVTFRLDSNDQTLTQYPFAFSFLVTYRLDNAAVKITYEVRNHSQKIMPFAVGGHPGFRVPLVDGEQFTDYVLEFSQTCVPDRIGLTSDVFISGKDDVYPLEDGCRIPMRRDLFGEDTLILKNMGREVKFYSKISGRSILITYPQMPYLALWQNDETSRYLCIEPWSSLPARQDVVEEFLCKGDMIQLMPGCVYENTWSIAISGGQV